MLKQAETDLTWQAARLSVSPESGVIAPPKAGAMVFRSATPGITIKAQAVKIKIGPGAIVGLKSMATHRPGHSV